MKSLFRCARAGAPAPAVGSTRFLSQDLEKGVFDREVGEHCCQVFDREVGDLAAVLSRVAEAEEPLSVCEGRRLVEQFAQAMVKGVRIRQIDETMADVALFTALSPDLSRLEITARDGEVVEFPMQCLIAMRSRARLPHERAEVVTYRERALRLFAEQFNEELPRVSYHPPDIGDEVDYVVVLDFPLKRLAFIFEDRFPCERFSRSLWIVRQSVIKNEVDRDRMSRRLSDICTAICP